MTKQSAGDPAQGSATPTPPSSEPVAWTNEAQLGFLKDPQYARIPMAMWADRGFIDDIPLYAHPQPAGAEREEDALDRLEAAFVDLTERFQKLPRPPVERIDTLQYCVGAIRDVRATSLSPVRSGRLEEVLQQAEATFENIRTILRYYGANATGGVCP